MFLGCDLSARLIHSSQAASNLALQQYASTVSAYDAKNLESFVASQYLFGSLLSDVDTMLLSTPLWLLDKWIYDARATVSPPDPATDDDANSASGSSAGCYDYACLKGCAIPYELRINCSRYDMELTDCEYLGCCTNTTFPHPKLWGGSLGFPVCFFKVIPDADLLEQNARLMVRNVDGLRPVWRDVLRSPACVLQVTQFGPPSSGLHDYSYRLWAGLLSSFYAQRWKQWGDGVGVALLTGKPYNQTAFDANVTSWELEWTQTIAGNLTVNSTGNPFELSQKLYSDWFSGNGTMKM